MAKSFKMTPKPKKEKIIKFGDIKQQKEYRGIGGSKLGIIKPKKEKGEEEFDLADYLEHKESCPHYNKMKGLGYKCNCGLLEAQEKLNSFLSQQIKKARRDAYEMGGSEATVLWKKKLIEAQKEILEKVVIGKEDFLPTVGYLRAKFTGILARKKWDSRDITDIKDFILMDLEALKEKLKEEI